MKEKIKLNFKINEDYLVFHVVSSGFFSDKHKKDIAAFRNFAWGKSNVLYNFLRGAYDPSLGVAEFSKKILEFVSSLRKSKEFKLILDQTKDYLSFCEKQWMQNYVIGHKTIKDLTGFKLDETFDVYITHPSLANGAFLAPSTIRWGHSEDWPNYTTVYLWHEVLHSYFQPSTEINHALIELITDNELRIRLNGGEYPPLVGHETLSELREKILPYWRDYLKRNKKDIFELEKALEKKLKLARLSIFLALCLCSFVLFRSPSLS